MREVWQQVRESLTAERPFVLCRLVETRGSTPQKPGATMLVYADGSQAGTLGGGCVEAEVKRRALEIAEGGTPEIATFQLDSDYGWDDGLICGGRMKIALEPFGPESNAEYVLEVARQFESDTGSIEAVVFDSEATGLPAPSNYLFAEDGTLIAHCRAELQDGLAPTAVVSRLPNISERPRPLASHGVAYLPLLPRCRLVIVGGGHVGQAVAALADDVGFNVWVVDDRADIVSEERFPSAERRITGDVSKVLPEVEITPSTYCLIVTRGHNHDEEALYHLAERGARYVGMIGSKRKIKMIFDDLLNEGIAPESLRQVYAPVGLDIGSQTVSEIAISIVAELIAHRNRGGEVVGRLPAVALDVVK